MFCSSFCLTVCLTLFASLGFAKLRRYNLLFYITKSSDKYRLRFRKGRFYDESKKLFRETFKVYKRVGLLYITFEDEKSLNYVRHYEGSKDTGMAEFMDTQMYILDNDILVLLE